MFKSVQLAGVALRFVPSTTTRQHSTKSSDEPRESNIEMSIAMSLFHVLVQRSGGTALSHKNSGKPCDESTMNMSGAMVYSINKYNDESRHSTAVAATNRARAPWIMLCSKYNDEAARHCSSDKPRESPASAYTYIAIPWTRWCPRPALCLSINPDQGGRAKNHTSATKNIEQTLQLHRTLYFEGYR